MLRFDNHCVFGLPKGQQDRQANFSPALKIGQREGEVNG